MQPIPVHRWVYLFSLAAGFAVVAATVFVATIASTLT
jgi:hypothetical protein